MKFLTGSPGKVGCVEACDGRPLPTGRVIARKVPCDSFQDARAFLLNGGERGPQMALITPGTYRINPLLKVIARFGAMDALVTQVLEPTIGNYFRNAAQGSDIIDFLKSRSLRQEEARSAISAALREYNVGAVDTLIGDR